MAPVSGSVPLDHSSQLATEAGRRTEVASPARLAERSAPLLPPSGGIRHTSIYQTAPHFVLFIVNSPSPSPYAPWY